MLSFPIGHVHQLSSGASYQCTTSDNLLSLAFNKFLLSDIEPVVFYYFVVLKVGCVGGSNDVLPTWAFRGSQPHFHTLLYDTTYIDIDTPVSNLPLPIWLFRPDVIIPLIERKRVPSEEFPFLNWAEVQCIGVADRFSAVWCYIIDEYGMRGMLRNDVAKHCSIVEFDQAFEVIDRLEGDTRDDILGIYIAESFVILCVEGEVEESQDTVDGCNGLGISRGFCCEHAIGGKSAGNLSLCEAEEGES